MYSRFKGNSKTQKSSPFLLTVSNVSSEDDGEPAFNEGLIKMSRDYTWRRDELVRRYNNLVVLDDNGKYRIKDVPILEIVWTEIPVEFKETENGRKVDKQLKKLSGQSEDIIKLKTDLEDDSFPVIFAGETSSGKSTLINLVIGADILPTHVLPCTPVICHIKENERKRLAIFKDNQPPILEKDIKSENELKEILSQYLKLDTRGRINRECDLVEIHWPMKHLKGVITLVDSPGITDDENMNKKVLQYIPKAVAFVYVINSSNAGGIFKDRIELIWTEQNQKEHEGKLPTPNVDCSLIVCNKWDLVDEKEDVKQYIRHKLDSNIHLKYLKDSNIIEMNAKEAKQESTYNCDYKKFMTALIDVMRESLPNKLKRHEEVLCQISKDKEEVKNYLMVIIDETIKDRKHKVENKKQSQTHIEETLKYLNKQTYDGIKQIMKNLAIKIRNEVISTANITNAEKAVDAKFRLIHTNDMQVAKDIAKPLIKEQIRTHLKKWEEANCLPFLKKEIQEKLNNFIRMKDIGCSEAIFDGLVVNTDIKLELVIPRMPGISQRIPVWPIINWLSFGKFEKWQIQKERKELQDPEKRRGYLRSWIIEACNSVTLYISEEYTKTKYEGVVLDAVKQVKEKYEEALKQVDSEIRDYECLSAKLINYRVLIQPQEIPRSKL